MVMSEPLHRYPAVSSSYAQPPHLCSGFDEGSAVRHDGGVKYLPVENEAAGTTEIVPGIHLWNEVKVQVEDYHGMDLQLVVRLIDGRLSVDELTVTRPEGGAPITADSLRAIALAQLVKHSLEAHARAGGNPFAGLVGTQVAFGLLPRKDRDRMREAGPVTETLRHVAAIYKVALAVGDAPTKAVQDVFEVPRYTADRWVAKARERHFLGAAEGPGKAGA